MVGLKLLRHLAPSGLKPFTVQQAKEAACELKLNPEYTTQALHHLVKETSVIRVKKTYMLLLQSLVMESRLMISKFLKSLIVNIFSERDSNPY